MKVTNNWMGCVIIPANGMNHRTDVSAEANNSSLKASLTSDWLCIIVNLYALAGRDVLKESDRHTLRKKEPGSEVSSFRCG